MPWRTIATGWAIALPVLFAVAVLVEVYFGGFIRLGERIVAASPFGEAPVEQTASFSYPMGTEGLVPGPANCDYACMASRAPENRSAIYLGTGETGLFYAPAPPAGCTLLSLRMPNETVPGITDAAGAVIFDGAPQRALQVCNPAAAIPDYDFGIRIPAWFRTEHSVVVAVPGESLIRNYIVHVCALADDGRVLEFAGDPSRTVMLPVNDGKCGSDDVTRPPT